MLKLPFVEREGSGVIHADLDKNQQLLWQKDELQTALQYKDSFDNFLKGSQIFGNTLEALVGAVYLDKGYVKTKIWVTKHMIIPHLYVDDLEQVDINLKNKLIGWASKNGKTLEFETISEKLENNRRIFVIAVVIDGSQVATGRAFNKKDASQVAANEAIKKLAL